jgi:hypothetical protein
VQRPRRLILLAIPLLLLGGGFFSNVAGQDGDGGQLPAQPSPPGQTAPRNGVPDTAPACDPSTDSSCAAPPAASAASQTQDPSQAQDPSSGIPPTSVPSGQGKKSSEKKTSVARPRAPEDESTSEDAPLRFFWATDKTSIRIGEIFYLKITGRTYDTKTKRAFLDRRVFEPSAVNLSPYEIVSSETYPDVRRGDFLYFQYVYAMRLVGSQFFGKEVKIPSLNFSYSMQETNARGENIETKDIPYRMKEYVMKVQSLVPGDASDIRDARWRTFGDGEKERFRANAAFLASIFLSILAVAVFLFQVLATVRRRRGNGEKAMKSGWSNRKLLEKLLTVFDEIRTSREQNVAWDDSEEELAGRALNAFRVCGALTLGREIVQKGIGMQEIGLEGQLKFTEGIFFSKRRQVVVYSDLTPEEMEQAILHNTSAGILRQKTDDFLRAFSVMNEAHYSAGALNGAELDGALETGFGFVSFLEHEQRWHPRLLKKIRNLDLVTFLGQKQRWYSRLLKKIRNRAR